MQRIKIKNQFVLNFFNIFMVLLQKEIIEKKCHTPDVTPSTSNGTTSSNTNNKRKRNV